MKDIEDNGYKIGRGFSKPIITFAPIYTIAFVIQPCDHKGLPVGVSQTIQIGYQLDGLLEANRVISKTKFLNKASKYERVLIYHIDIKVADYQDALSDCKKVNQKDYTEDIFLDYYHNVISNHLEADNVFDFKEIREKIISEIKEELSEEWCKVDHIISDALSTKSKIIK